MLSLLMEMYDQRRRKHVSGITIPKNTSFRRQTLSKMLRNQLDSSAKETYSYQCFSCTAMMQNVFRNQGLSISLSSTNSMASIVAVRNVPFPRLLCRLETNIFLCKWRRETIMCLILSVYEVVIQWPSML